MFSAMEPSAFHAFITQESILTFAPFELESVIDHWKPEAVQTCETGAHSEGRYHQEAEGSKGN